jgi:NADH:ubiquinone oxidoreductase subunit H
MRFVTVVLPLLPVIQIFIPFAYLPANSISEITGIPFSLIFLIIGAFSCIPGLLINHQLQSILIHYDSLPPI